MSYCVILILLLSGCATQPLRPSAFDCSRLPGLTMIDKRTGVESPIMACPYSNGTVGLFYEFAL